MTRVSAPPAPPGTGARRVDGSMSLLVDVMTNTLDEAYAARAARKAGLPEQPPARGGGRGRVGSHVVGVVALVLLGLLTGTAVSQVRARAEAAAGLRDGLAEAVRERGQESDRLQREVAALRTRVAATRDAALGADAAGVAAAEAVAALELAVGTTPVQGPGIRLTLDDAPSDGDSSVSPEVRGGAPDISRVNDRDLQSVVNGLWAAGAEAISINGVRLSSRSAIRSAGEAVLVDFRPLSPPYEIEAVGRPADLEVDFLDGPAGRSLQALATVTGITVDLARDDELTLAAATEPELRAAVPLEGSS